MFVMLTGHWALRCHQKHPRGSAKDTQALTNQAAAQGTRTVSATTNCCGTACHTHDIQPWLRWIYILSCVEDA